MQGLFVDIENDLVEIQEEAVLLANFKSNFNGKNSDSLQDFELWGGTVAIASGVEKVYTGCERVMKRVAEEIDEAPIKGDAWHATLLKRMANHYPGQRGNLISQETFDALDKVRAFRHRERNSYGTKLNTDIVMQRADECIQAFELFMKDVLQFKHKMLNEGDRPMTVAEFLHQRIKASKGTAPDDVPVEEVTSQPRI